MSNENALGHIYILAFAKNEVKIGVRQAKYSGITMPIIDYYSNREVIDQWVSPPIANHLHIEHMVAKHFRAARIRGTKNYRISMKEALSYTLGTLELKASKELLQQDMLATERMDIEQDKLQGEVKPYLVKGRPVAAFWFLGQKVSVTTDAEGELWFTTNKLAKALGFSDGFNAVRKHCGMEPSYLDGIAGPSTRTSVIDHMAAEALAMASMNGPGEFFNWVENIVNPFMATINTQEIEEATNKQVLTDIKPLAPYMFDEHAIRVFQCLDGEPWFVATDICKVLGLENVTSALLKLDDDEQAQVIDSYGLESLEAGDMLNVVNEAGFYMLVMRCRKAAIRGTKPYRFRRWVTWEVLPAIRKTGSYSRPNATATPPETSNKSNWDSIDRDLLFGLLDRNEKVALGYLNSMGIQV